MPATALAQPVTPVNYPDSDGMPMADNMAQFYLMMRLQANLDALLPCLVAGDLLWYPVEGDNKTRQAPDVMVALGRPKGLRSSYRQWEEEGIAPSVVFEILSPGNTVSEMIRKFGFYQAFGVQEYYVYDPVRRALQVYIRDGALLSEVEFVGGWQSPLLGVRMHPGEDLELFGPDGAPFLSFTELKARADADRGRAEAEAQRAEAEAQRAEAERRRADELAARLRALGVEV